MQLSKLFIFFFMICTSLSAAITTEEIDIAINKKDYETSYKLSQRLCGQGNGLGCFYLAIHYDMALGVTQNLQQAIYLYSRGCQYENIYLACHNLGALYFKGNGIEKDLKKANELFTKACKGGLKESCDTLKQINNKDSTETTQKEKSKTSHKQQVIQQPNPLNREDEILFIKILTQYQQAYLNTKNQLKQSLLKEERTKTLQTIFKSPQVNGWIGIVKSIKIVTLEDDVELVVEIAPNIRLGGTSFWGNHDALIPRNSKLFKIVSNLEVGQKISFSGTLYHAMGNNTINPTYFAMASDMFDGMKDPIFLFKFTSLETISTGEQVDQNIVSDDTLNMKLKQAELALKKQKEDISLYDKAFATKVEKIIASNWDKTPDTFDGNTAKVRIKISDQGVFSHKIVSLSYNNEFNTKLKQFLKNMEKQEFPKYEKGTFFETQIELKDVLK